MDEGTTYVGMAVHGRTIAVSVRFPDGRHDERTIPHETRAVNRLVRKLKREAPGSVLCAYEARPCGYGSVRGGLPNATSARLPRERAVRTLESADRGCSEGGQQPTRRIRASATPTTEIAAAAMASPQADKVGTDAETISNRAWL